MRGFTAKKKTVGFGFYRRAGEQLALSRTRICAKYVREGLMMWTYGCRQPRRIIGHKRVSSVLFMLVIAAGREWKGFIPFVFFSALAVFGGRQKKKTDGTWMALCIYLQRYYYVL